MRKAIIVAALIAIISFTHTDGYSVGMRVGVKGGFNLTYYQLSEYDNSSKLLGAGGGAFLDLIIVDLEMLGFGIEVDVMYQKRDGEFFSGEERIKYLGIPVILKIHAMKNIVNFGVGINYQQLQSAKYKSVTDNNIKDTNFEFVATIGFAYPIVPKVLITGDLRAYAGVLNVNKDSSYPFETRSVDFMLGLGFSVF